MVIWEKLHLTTNERKFNNFVDIKSIDINNLRHSSGGN